MKFKFFTLLAFVLCFAGKNKITTGSNQFDGAWMPIKQEIGGTQLPLAAFETHRLMIKDTTYTYTAESVDKGVVKYEANIIDIYGKEGANAGKHFIAIYKYEEELLTICYNLAGDSYPESFETKGKPLFFISVFKKEK